jgi:hypothetical protein
MFFSCFFPDQASRQTYRAKKLEMLKAMRDSLETRLAALNAAIETLERQQNASSVE